jgi:VanZ family protein
LKILNRIFWSFSTGIYLALLTFASLKPPAATYDHSITKAVLHNLTHVPAYAILTYFFFVTARALRLKSNPYLTAILAAFAFGILMECLQSLVPGRESSLMDVGLNTMGIVTTVVIFKRGYFRS